MDKISLKKRKIFFSEFVNETKIFPNYFVNETKRKKTVSETD